MTGVEGKRQAGKAARWTMWVLLAAMLAGRPCVRAATMELADEKTLTGTVLNFEKDALLVQIKAGEEPRSVPLADVVQIWFTASDGQRSKASEGTPANSGIRIVARTPASSAPATQSGATQPAAASARAISTWRIEYGVADHVTAALESWSDKQAALRIETLDNARMKLPLEEIREFWTPSEAKVKKARALKVEVKAQDVAFVEKDGEVRAVSGTVKGIDEETLWFAYEGEERKIKLDRLVGVILAEHEVAGGKELFESFTLSNGDMFSGHLREVENGVIRIALGEGGQGPEVRVPAGKLSKIKVKNGRLVWVSELRPARVEQAPYFDRLFPYQTDQSLTGGPLSLLDGTVTKGIAVHARCLLTYELDGMYATFRSRVGFQQPEGKIGRAAVRVRGDDKVLWENEDLKGDAKPTLVEVKVEGVKRLVLEVDYGKNQDVGDRVIWGEAKLLKGTASTMNAP